MWFFSILRTLFRYPKLRRRNINQSGKTLLRRFDNAVSWAKAHPPSKIRSKLFQRIYLELTKYTLSHHLEDRNIKVLKTDLWNEGVDHKRDILTGVSEIGGNRWLVGVDFDWKLCYASRRRLYQRADVCCSSCTDLPFKAKSFDLVLDISTIDHIPPTQRGSVIQSYHSILNDGGMLVIAFDSGLNAMLNIYQRVYLKRIFPVWTLKPPEVKRLLKTSGFDVVDERATYLAGMVPNRFLSIIDGFLEAKADLVWSVVKAIEMAQWSKYFAPLAQQYTIIAKRLPNIA